MAAQVIPFWSVEDPTHECAMEVQTLEMAVAALLRRFSEQPDIVRDEATSIGEAYMRMSFLASAVGAVAPLRAAG